MSYHLATLAFSIAIAALFLLDRDRSLRTSKALWIATLWLFISGSRPLSQWLAAFGFAGTTVQIDSPDAYLEGSPIDRALFATLLIAGIAAAAARQRRVGQFIRGNRPLIVFFLYTAVSVFWSDYPLVAFKRWIKSIGDIVIVMLVLTEDAPNGALRRILTRTGFVLIPVSVLFIKYYPELGRAYNRWTWLPSYTGVTTNKNELGMMCLVFGLGSLWQWLAAMHEGATRNGKRRVAAHLCVLGMAFWLFWVANSMTSLSCFIIAGVALAVLSLRRFAGKAWVAHLLVLGAIGLSGFALFLDADGSIVNSLGRDPSLTGRTEIWNVVLAVSANPWGGAGFESFWLGDRLQYIWDHTMNGLQEAHNGYLEVYLNLGCIGVGLLAVLMVAGYRNILLALRRDPRNGAIRLAYFIVALVYNLTEAGFRETSLGWIFFLLATCPAVPTAAHPQPGAKHRPRVRYRPWRLTNPAAEGAGAGRLVSL